MRVSRQQNRLLAETEGAEHPGDNGRLRRIDGQPVDEFDLVVRKPGSEGHAGRRLQRLPRHPPAEVPRPLGEDVTAAPTRAAAPRSGTGVASALLAIQLAGRARHLAPGLRLLGPLPLIGLIHDYRIVQQLLAHLGRELGGVDLVGPNLLAGHVVDGEVHLAPAFFLPVGAATPTFLILFVCITVTNVPLAPGTAPRTSSRFRSLSIPTTFRLRIVDRSLP